MNIINGSYLEFGFYSQELEKKRIKKKLQNLCVIFFNLADLCIYLLLREEGILTSYFQYWFLFGLVSLKLEYVLKLLLFGIDSTFILVPCGDFNILRNTWNKKWRLGVTKMRVGLLRIVSSFILAKRTIYPTPTRYFFGLRL